ncbi:MAG: hypothetical protein J1E60_01435 [Christensenellaceae bacterium]|nr:hypothetical protein [Christensenellaceae bacterium]
MLFGCYYKNEHEVLLVMDLKPADRDMFVCYKCKRNEDQGRESLVWNAYYPVGEPFLKSRSEVEAMQCLNARCLSCVFFETHLASTEVRMKEGMKPEVIDVSQDDRRCKCNLRCSFLMDGVHEMFVDCAYYDDEPLKINVDVHFAGLGDELNKLYNDHGFKTVNALTNSPSPAVFEKLISDLDDADKCYFCGAEIDHVFRDGISEFLNTTKQRMMSIGIKKKFLNAKLYARLMSDTYNNDIIYIPKKNVAVYAGISDLGCVDMSYCVCASMDIATLLQEAESEFMKKPNKLYHMGSYQCDYIRTFTPEKWNLDLYGKQNDY